MALAYRGGKSANAGSGATDWSIDLTALSGGSGAAAQAGDIVIVVFSDHYPADGTGNMSVNTSGYTAIDGGGLHSTDSRQTNMRIFYKVMGVTPDTTLSLHDGSSGGDVGATGSVSVWSGINAATQMDVSPVPATGTNTGTPDPAAILPVTTGAVVLAIGGGSATSDRTMTAPSGFGNLIFGTNTQSSQNSTCGIASIAWGGGSVNPGTFGGMSTSTSDSWCALTVALRPEPDSSVKTVDGLARASVKTADGLAIASIKNIMGLA